MSESPSGSQAGAHVPGASPAGAMTFSAFISYASENIERAEAICASLEAKGFRCWMAPRDIRAGFEYADEIVRGIEQSRCMVVVLSEAANASPFVRREVERAVSKRKPVFPVRIEEVLPSPGLELFISATHWIDAWDSKFTEQVDRLARDLSGFSAAAKPGWRARFRHMKRRAKQWAATGSLVIVAAAILLLVALVIVRQFPGSGGGGGVSRDAPQTNTSVVTGVPDRSTTTVAGGVVSAGDAGGNSAGAPVATGVIDRAREQHKQRALSTSGWMNCSGWFCSVTRLRNMFPAIRRISFGESRGALERTIDIVLAPNVADASELQNLVDRYVLDHIPVRPGLDSVFVRLGFYDGTQSDIRAIRIDNNERLTRGVSLQPLDKPDGVSVPILYAGYTLGEPAVRFTPHAPEGTASLMYSLDGGGYYPSPVVQSASRARTPRGFRFEGVPSHREVRIEVRMSDGSVAGPFRYDAAPAQGLILNTMKASLSGDLYGLVKCVRVTASFTDRTLERDRGSSDNNVRREANRITSTLQSEGLSFLTRAPATVCLPDWQTHSVRTRNFLGDWAAVQEIRFGTRPGRLGQKVRNTLELQAALENRIPRGRDFASLWNVVLPGDTEGVYAQLEFRDGSTSEEFRIPITDLRISG
jgi:hypothetical protein